MISVVVLAFGRRERLAMVLNGLAQQTQAGKFEVVVVSDGLYDTDAYLRSSERSLDVAVLTQPNSGPAAARNAGVAASRGDIILFLDDDVMPASDLVEQHRLAHESSPAEIVVIGPVLTPSDADVSHWEAWEQALLLRQYNSMLDGEFDCGFRQFYGGNASVPRQRLIGVGLFNVGHPRTEDLEMAVRLHESGLAFQFVPEARGYRRSKRDFDSWLASAHQAGLNDVAFTRDRHGRFTSTMLAEFRRRDVLVRGLTRLLVPRPRLADAVTSSFRSVAVGPIPLGPARRSLLSGVHGLAYYRGVAAGCGSAHRFRRAINGLQLAPDSPMHAAFVLEQVLGHATHSDNLGRIITATDELAPSFLPIPFEMSPRAAWIPGYGNWTIRAGLRARRAIRREHRGPGIDVMFIHTQVPALLAGAWMSRIPTVVSLDATPRQIDQMGDHYDHRTSSGRVERWKYEANRRCFRRARHLVAWSTWTREALVRDYGVDRERVSVIAPGVDLSRWEYVRPEISQSDSPVGVLFVGGGLDRKGGLLLLEVARRLRSRPGVPEFEVHLVTNAEVPAEPGVVCHNGLTPNSPTLIDLYHQCEIFCLPTLGDCLPLVLAEAAACSMALVSTSVGAIHEIVRDGETGVLLEPGNVDALEGALLRLISDQALRRRLGEAAHDLARREHDAHVNANRIVKLLVAIRAEYGWETQALTGSRPNASWLRWARDAG